MAQLSKILALPTVRKGQTRSLSTSALTALPPAQNKKPPEAAAPSLPAVDGSRERRGGTSLPTLEAVRDGKGGTASSPNLVLPKVRMRSTAQKFPGLRGSQVANDQRSDIKKALLTFNRAEDPEEQLMKLLYQLFLAYDRNGSGDIDVDEFMDAHLRLEPQYARKPAKAVADFLKADVDKTGSLTFDEFKRWQLKLMGALFPEQMVEVVRQKLIQLGDGPGWKPCKLHTPCARVLAPKYKPLSTALR